MVLNDFECEECGLLFEIMWTAEDIELGNFPYCPKCKGNTVVVYSGGHFNLQGKDWHSREYDCGGGSR